MEATTSFTQDTQKSVDDFAGDRLLKEQAMAMVAKHNETLPETPDRNEYGFITSTVQKTGESGQFVGSQGTEGVIISYLQGLYKEKAIVRETEVARLELELSDDEGEMLQLQVLLRDYVLEMEKMDIIRKTVVAKRTKKQKEYFLEEPSLVGKIKEIKEVRIPTIEGRKLSNEERLLFLKEQSEREEGEKLKAMEFASISAHAVQKATGALFERRDFCTSTPFRTEVKVQPGAFTRIEAGLEILDKERLLVSGGRIIQIGNDARVGDILTPNWKDYGARKNFKLYFEELYLYLLRPEYVETEVSLEVIADMGMAFSKDSPEEQAKYAEFMQKIFDVQSLIVRRKSTLSRKGLVTAIGGVFTRDRQQELASMLQDKMAVTIYAGELKKVAHFPTRLSLGQTYKGEKKPRRFGKNINFRLNFGITKPGNKRPWKGNASNSNGGGGSGKYKKGKWTKEGKPICDGCGKSGHIRKNCRAKQGGGGRPQHNKSQQRNDQQTKQNTHTSEK